MKRYENFTRWFLGMSPDELTELGRAIQERKFQREQQELREDEQKMIEEFNKEHHPNL